MSLLCGYLGARDDSRLRTMADSAGQRGLKKTELHSFKNQLNIAIAHDANSSNLAGLSQNGNAIIALVGMPVCPGCESTADLLERLNRDGLEILNQLEGSYVGLIFYQDHLYLIRDKAGRRTLFYTDSVADMSFATETQILYRSAHFSSQIRPAAIAQYLAFSYIPGESTMLEGLKELMAGCYLDTRDSQQRRYFQPELDSPVGCDDWVEKFRELLHQSIERTRPSNMTDFAVFLSGGIDSSIVTAALTENYGPDKVKAFGIHFGEKFPNELEHIRVVAKHLGVRCEEVEVNPRCFLPCLHEIVENLNDPIGDPVTMPNYLLAQHVSRQGYHGVYNGEGGDPIFGGPKNMTMLLHHWYGNIEGGNHREQAYLASYRRSYEEIHHLLTPEWQQKINIEQDLEATLSPMFQTDLPQSFLKKLLLINMRQKGAHLILPKVERMLGAHGITPLSPLFDESLIQLCMQLPGDLILKNGIEKISLKEAYRGRLPASIIDRPKSGMRVPVHYWFKGEMKRYAKKMLCKKRLEQSAIFDPKRVKQLLNYETHDGPGRYGIKLWMLLTFELWREKVFGE